uniref:EcbI n=1 Tax=Pasteurella multocida TaxID=747 RepID=Q9AHL9_PASMD|nr:EcbI [Pasteurella multocida]
MKVYLISDNLTQESLNLENIEIKNSWFNLSNKKNSILFVESAWTGYRKRWKYKIAAYPNNNKRTNEKLLKIISLAKDKGIPAVFWNKEDSIHFDRFINSAKYFDHIFTVDQNCVERYRTVVPPETTVDVAMFPVQPRIHNYQGFNFKHMAANFIGSYSKHIHDKRRERQELSFRAAFKTGLPVTVFDRNSDRKSDNYRYPTEEFCLTVRPAVDYVQTADIYRQFAVSLNVNTIEDSPTMYSRRVVEVLACAGILVSTPSLAVERLFKDYCHIVNSEEEAIELFERLKYGPSSLDLEMAKAGADFVLNNFTWHHFLQKIKETIERNK